MNRKLKTTLIAVPVVAGLAVGGVAVAGVADDDDANQVRITGQSFNRASEAALAHTGGGRVTETEAGDEEGAYEVEVTKDDGSQVDVHLDRDFKVLSAEDEGSDDD